MEFFFYSTPNWYGIDMKLSTVRLWRSSFILKRVRCRYVRANQIVEITSFSRRMLQSVMVWNGPRKERNPLQEGPLKGIGSSVGMQPYKGGVGINLEGTSN